MVETRLKEIEMMTVIFDNLEKIIKKVLDQICKMPEKTVFFNYNLL